MCHPVLLLLCLNSCSAVSVYMCACHPVLLLLCLHVLQCQYVYHPVLLLLYLRSAMSVSVPSSSAATVSSCSTTSSKSLPSQSTLSVIVPSHKRSVSNFSSEKTWCYCGQDELYDKMIACEHPDCEIEWFHYSCGMYSSLPSVAHLWCCYTEL